MTPTERSPRISAALSEREQRMYAVLRSIVSEWDSPNPLTYNIAPHIGRARTLLAAIDAEILAQADPGPAPLTTGA